MYNFESDRHFVVSVLFGFAILLLPLIMIIVYIENKEVTELHYQYGTERQRLDRIEYKLDCLASMSMRAEKWD